MDFAIAIGLNHLGEYSILGFYENEHDLKEKDENYDIFDKILENLHFRGVENICLLNTSYITNASTTVKKYFNNTVVVYNPAEALRIFLHHATKQTKEEHKQIVQEYSDIFNLNYKERENRLSNFCEKWQNKIYSVCFIKKILNEYLPQYNACPRKIMQLIYPNPRLRQLLKPLHELQNGTTKFRFHIELLKVVYEKTVKKKPCITELNWEETHKIFVETFLKNFCKVL